MTLNVRNDDNNNRASGSGSSLSVSNNDNNNMYKNEYAKACCLLQSAAGGPFDIGSTRCLPPSDGGAQSAFRTALAALHETTAFSEWEAGVKKANTVENIRREFQRTVTVAWVTCEHLQEYSQEMTSDEIWNVCRTAEGIVREAFPRVEIGGTFDKISKVISLIVYFRDPTGFKVVLTNDSKLQRNQSPNSTVLSPGRVVMGDTTDEPSTFDAGNVRSGGPHVNLPADEQGVAQQSSCPRFTAGISQRQAEPANQRSLLWQNSFSIFLWDPGGATPWVQMLSACPASLRIWDPGGVPAATGSTPFIVAITSFIWINVVLIIRITEAYNLRS